MSIDELEKFLKEFSKNIRYEEPTFMEVSGYPHYEKVCSNILGFYFDPDKEHGFGTLVLNALMRSAKIQLELDDSRFEIETEYPTTKDNYIDLVIYNDELAIGIENKIFATVYNDLDDYAKTIDELGKVSYKIILSLNDESKIANEHNFINVTYDELFSNLRELIGENWDRTNKWHLFLQEFMQTLENLKRAKSIDKQNLEWAKNNRKQILSVNRILKYNYADDEMQGLLQKYRKEVRKFNDFISEMKNDFNFQTKEFERFIRQNLDYKRFNVNKFWRHRDLQNLSYMCIFEIPKYNIAIDNVLDMTGWCINICIRGNGNPRIPKLKVLNKLNENNIETLVNSQGLYQDEYHLKIYELDFDATFDEIMNKDVKLLQIFE